MMEGVYPHIYIWAHLKRKSRKKYRCLFSHKSRFYKIYFLETGRPNGLLTKLIVGVKNALNKWTKVMVSNLYEEARIRDHLQIPTRLVG